jgi:hypothetical protein
VTPDQLATEGLAAQEAESLAACIARGQKPDTYQDILLKLRGHVEKLPPERRVVWEAQCVPLGVVLFPPPPKPAKSTKPEASSKP